MKFAKRSKALTIIGGIFRNLQAGDSVLNNIFIRIFNTLSVRVAMSFYRVAHRRGLSSRCCFFMLLALLVSGPMGCQKLFHDEGAPLKGQTVNLGVTVPETPPPASKPLAVDAHSVFQTAPQTPPPLPSRLLPQQEPAEQASNLTPVPVDDVVSIRNRSTITRADTVMVGRTLNEDTVLRGTVLVKGSLVVAPQATLRLEPGAILRFQRPAGAAQNPRLVVQGRLVCAGTLQKPVVIGAAFDENQAADWGGLLLLSTEKKNSLDYCRVEGAEVGIEARYSQFSGRGLEVARSREGVALYDSVATLQAATVSRCDVGLIASDSELDLREVTLRENRQGASVIRSSLVMTTCLLRGNSQEGLVADQCRFRMSGCSAVDNRIGILLKGGDGQLLQCRFALNRESGLAATGARVRITHSSFQDNLGAGLRLEGARGSVTQSSFSLNRGGNLVNTGFDGFAAVLNWWGTAEAARIAEGIQDASRATGMARISFVPFLLTRPALAP